jgi:Holliday junction resolvase RusA-like endonuclease
MFYFRAYGRPAPQGSKKFVGNGRFIEASKYLKPWRESLATAIWAAQESQDSYSRFEGPVVVEAVFLIAKPGSVKRIWPSVMPDLDKLQRGLGDALETDTQLLASDSLIVKWIASKVYVAPNEGGVVCTIRDATEEDLKELSDTAKNGY